MEKGGGKRRTTREDNDGRIGTERGRAEKSIESKMQGLRERRRKTRDERGGHQRKEVGNQKKCW